MRSRSVAEATSGRVADATSRSGEFRQRLIGFRENLLSLGLLYYLGHYLWNQKLASSPKCYNMMSP
jgi:hypothetical protein